MTTRQLVGRLMWLLGGMGAAVLGASAIVAHSCDSGSARPLAQATAAAVVVCFAGTQLDGFD